MANQGSEHDAEKEPRLRIGAVSRLTGIGVHTLRKWESRYQAVSPARTPAGGRLYSYEDVKRLILIKQWREAGRPLAEVAGADWRELELPENALSKARSQPSGSGIAEEIPVAVLGTIIPIRFAQNASLKSRLRLLASAASLEELARKVAGSRIDLVIVEVSAVVQDTVQLVDKAIAACGARGAMVVYGFGARKSLEMLRRREIVMMRAPVDFAEIGQMGAALMSNLSAGDVQDNRGRPGTRVPAPRFSLEQIAQVTNLSSKVDCDCARHIGTLISSLKAFEEYSFSCESSKLEQDELHRYFGETAAQARAAFEEAFARLVDLEGLELTG